MAKFKQFFLAENVGSHNLESRLSHALDTIGAGLNSYTKNGSKQLDQLISTVTSTPINKLEIPYVEKNGRIDVLQREKNPIYVRLSDGTEAHFSFDEYKKIQGTPAVGKKMTLLMQRHSSDQSGAPSKICKAIVTD